MGMLEQTWSFADDLYYTRPIVTVKTTAMVLKKKVARSLFVWCARASRCAECSSLAGLCMPQARALRY